MNKVDVPARINDQMKAVLQKQNELAGDAFATNVGFEEMRENYVKERAFWNEGGPEMAKVVDATVPGAHGPAVPVRYYYPDNAPIDVLRPAIIYIHGGGFVVGNPTTHDRITRILAQKTGSVVVSVDYPLSPEAKFPQGLLACVDVARYLHEEGASVGVDGNDLAFSGDSGGANLSLASYLYLRDQLGDASFVTCLILYYGMYGLKDSMSWRLFGGPWDGLGKEDMDYYMDCYCADAQADSESPYLNCLAADLMHQVPPMYIAAAEFDPLRDDSLTLGAMLEEAGQPYQLNVFDGVLHAFLHHSRMLDAASQALEQGSAFYATRHLHGVR